MPHRLLHLFNQLIDTTPDPTAYATEPNLWPTRPPQPRTRPTLTMPPNRIVYAGCNWQLMRGDPHFYTTDNDLPIAYWRQNAETDCYHLLIPLFGQSSFAHTDHSLPMWFQIIQHPFQHYDSALYFALGHMTATQ